MERTEEGRDLIETLWNVKIIINDLTRGKKIRFNRDIVECKGLSARPGLYCDSSI